MIDIVRDGVDAYDLPAGMCLVARPGSQGAYASVAKLDGNVSFTSTNATGIGASAVAGPFSAPCKLLVEARGTVSVEVVSGASQALVSGGGIAPLKILSPDGTDVGDVLTASLATGWTVTGYQWTRDGADIAGATTSTYTILAGDAGKTIGCRAAGALYTATQAIPVPSAPSNALTLDALPITLDALSITLV